MKKLILLCAVGLMTGCASVNRLNNCYLKCYDESPDPSKYKECATICKCVFTDITCRTWGGITEEATK